MSHVLVIKENEAWIKYRTTWFEVNLTDDVKLTDVNYVCIYNGDGTGGGGDVGGWILKVKEWSTFEVDAQVKRSVGAGAYSIMPGYIIKQFGLTEAGITRLESTRLEDGRKWDEIPVGPRDPKLEKMAINLQTAKRCVGNFYGVDAEQVFITIKG